MQCPKAALFDLDDTLAHPHTLISPAAAQKVVEIASRIPFAIVTAADYPRIERDVLSQLPTDSDLSNIYVFSENAAQCRRCKNGAWVMEYGEIISETDRAAIKQAIEEAMAETHALDGVEMYSERVLDREAGVTLATLGVAAPQEARKAWDPDQSKRRRLYESIKAKLPHWHVYIGGLTSIDISRENVSKERAVRWFAEHLGMSPQEMLYVGDALYPGGNDQVVAVTGIQTRSTSGPEETLQIMDELLTSCAIQK